MFYKSQLQKNVSNLIGKLTKRQIIRLFGDENIPISTICEFEE